MMAQHGGQAAISCQMCEQSSQIKKKCLDCDYLLCGNCCQLHKKVKELSDHQLIDLQDIGSIKERGVAHLNFKNVECRSHAEQKCCLFCEDCDKVVCVICISETHNQHKMIQMKEGHKLQIDKIARWRTEIKKKIETLTEDMSTLDTKYSTEISKFSAEKEKILGHDRVLKDAVDTQTKSFVSDLDQRWNKINKSVKDEISHAEKCKQRLQSREEKLKQALESSNAGDVFSTVEKENRSMKSDKETKVSLKFETLPTFKTKEIDLSVLNSQHGSLHDIKSTGNTKTDVKDIKIKVVESYQTDILAISSIQCKPDGTIWINYYLEDVLKYVEKCESSGTLKTKMKFGICVKNITLTPKGNLLLSCRGSNLLMIPHKQQTITRSIYTVSPLVTTAALHFHSNKIIVGARDDGPLYPASGPRQIIVMDTQGKYEKVYQFDASKRPLFTNPRRVTADSKNSLYVLDRQWDSDVGRVVTINNHTGKIIIYKGHPKVNNHDHPFTPTDLVATKSDNIVVSDMENNLLHILNSHCECVKYINTEELGIKRPWALNIDKRDLLHIGCDKELTLKVAIGLSRGAKLHIVKFTGF